LVLPIAVAVAVAIAVAAAHPASAPDATQGYALPASAGDTTRLGTAPAPGRERVTALPAGAEIAGFLSPRGLPPVAGRFIVTDTGLVFHSTDGRVAQTYPLIGPVREREGRRWRAAAVSLAYADSARERPVYLFRVDGGVFGTESPGPLLDMAGRPGWLDSVASRGWRADRPMVHPRDTAAIWRVTREIEGSAFADTLYSLFGRPARPAGLVGNRGRTAGRLGEYIASRDSVALDPARMSGPEQLRHALTHELAHRWQARSPAQLRTLWQGIAPIPDTRRYGHGRTSEHQAEAIAFAVHFLQATAAAPDTSALALLDQYELLVPGTGAISRYLALQPVYAQHPLQRILTTGKSQ
jgi:hypothetical protein